MTAVRRAASTGVAAGALARAINRWSSEWGVPNLARSVSFRINGRLRKSIARWAINAQCVEVGPRFFSPDLNHGAIICHELAHATALAKHGHRVRAHGPEWSALVRAAGFDPHSYKVGSRAQAVARRPRANPSRIYEHRCLVCHWVRYGRRPVRAWRCMECVEIGLGGELEITSVAFGGRS